MLNVNLRCRKNVFFWKSISQFVLFRLCITYTWNDVFPELIRWTVEKLYLIKWGLPSSGHLVQTCFKSQTKIGLSVCLYLEGSTWKVIRYRNTKNKILICLNIVHLIYLLMLSHLDANSIAQLRLFINFWMPPSSNILNIFVSGHFRRKIRSNDRRLVPQTSGSGRPTMHAWNPRHCRNGEQCA